MSRARSNMEHFVPRAPRAGDLIMARNLTIARLDEALQLAVATIERLADTDARRASVGGTLSVAKGALAQSAATAGIRHP